MGGGITKFHVFKMGGIIKLTFIGPSKLILTKPGVKFSRLRRLSCSDYSFLKEQMVLKFLYPFDGGDHRVSGENFA